eukprot:7805482-Pyramimonas_sp.AAC.1
MTDLPDEVNRAIESFVQAAVQESIRSFPSPIVDNLARVVGDLQSAISNEDISGRDEWLQIL